jgi:hypothetical protein
MHPDRGRSDAGGQDRCVTAFRITTLEGGAGQVQSQFPVCLFEILNLRSKRGIGIDTRQGQGCRPRLRQARADQQTQQRPDQWFLRSNPMPAGAQAPTTAGADRQAFQYSIQQTCCSGR